MSIHDSMNQHAGLDRLFHPRSIAVLGASSTAGKIGAVPVTLLRQHGYGGAIYPVNPRSP
nr:CoA-binding protein [Pseudomonas sp.]